MRAIREIRDSLPEAAFFLGNGVNLNAGIMPSWESLLSGITNGDLLKEGLTNTEIYDLIELSSIDHKELKYKVASKLKLQGDENLYPHRRLMEYASITGSPVLTTNFDHALASSISAEKYHVNTRGFTRFYPWKTYYGHEQLNNPNEGFGIWHVHGNVEYPDSIRLGLTDYMGSVEKARGLVHNGDDRLFRGKNRSNWKGIHSWLHIWFNMPLIIFGFGYGSDEVFLRWLLIERKKYYNKFIEPMNVWFVTKGAPDIGTANLMRNLEVELIQVDDYDEIYG